VRFELATGKSAQSWMGHQAAFDDWHSAELRQTLAVRPWDAALQHRAAVEADLSRFMAAQGLKASWHQGDKLLRLQAARGGTTPAPIVVAFPDDFWGAYAELGKRYQKDARLNVVRQIKQTYSPTHTGPTAQEIAAAARAAFSTDE
jgi:hypothetical protein